MSPNSLFINILMDQQRNDTKSNTHAKATPLMMVLNASRAWDGVRGGWQSLTQRTCLKLDMDGREIRDL